MGTSQANEDGADAIPNPWPTHRLCQRFRPLPVFPITTILLYESGPAVKLGTSHLISTQAVLTDPRIVDGIEQRSFLYGLLLEGQG